MIPTVPYLKERYDAFNKMIFHDELPPIDIALSRAKGIGGRYVYKRKRGFLGLGSKDESIKIVISIYYDFPEREVEDTLIHEMIHYYIHHKGLKDSSAHGTIFRQMMMDINMRWGRHVTIKVQMKGDEKVVGRKVKSRFICISTFRDGSHGITVCAKTRLFDIHRALTHNNNIVQVDWYGTTDSYFEKYPASQTAKVYRITTIEMELHLKDAVELVCDGSVIKPK